MGNASKANTRYDRLSDVLYLSVGNGKLYRSAEDDSGLLWRFDEAGKAIGVTVQGYHICWADRRGDLVQRIAEPLRLDTKTLARSLPA